MFGGVHHVRCFVELRTQAIGDLLPLPVRIRRLLLRERRLDHGRDHGLLRLGHAAAMRKLLVLCYGVLKTGRPLDPDWAHKST